MSSDIPNLPLTGAIGDDRSRVHFILVHSACMGAWCWYKLQTLLEEEGYDVIVPDLKASGVNEAKIKDVHTFYDYTSPLFTAIDELIPQGDVAILVGNGTGGISIAMAAERYFRKVKALVFLGAFIPGTNDPPASVLEEFVTRVSHKDFWKDTQNPPNNYDEDQCHHKFMLVGPDFLKLNLYNYSPKENAFQAVKLVRPSSFFIQDLKLRKPENTLTNDNYGQAKRVVIISKNKGIQGPQAITEEFNVWQMGKAGITTPPEIIEELTDDMSMVSKPEKVRDILLKIANEC